MNQRDSNRHIFRRKIYAKLEEWKAKASDRTALMVEGARRVGKSTIVEEFARNNYETYLLIDFTKVGRNVIDLFEDISDLHLFFLTLQSLMGVKLVPGKSCVIFDEVQFCPRARQAIKHLVKDGRYHYIETGSLISIKKNTRDILIPSEEKRLHMYPMDFEEFLWALDKDVTWDLIRYAFDRKKPLSDSVHREIMKLFRLYMIVGGMPQAVATYLDSDDFETIDDVKRDIINLYLDDFKKIDESGRAATIFKSIPAELARNTMRYRVGEVIPNTRLSRLESIFSDINESCTVNFAYHADDPNVGFAFHAGFDFFKMYVGDTGLFVTLGFMDRDFTENVIYNKLLSDKLSADLGYLYENVVAQLLKASGNSLFYYTFKERSESEEKDRNYEIDFLLSRRDKVYPIEVKSSGYKAHKSLDEFQRKYSSRIGGRYLIYTKDLCKEGDLVCLPVYMTGLL